MSKYKYLDESEPIRVIVPNAPKQAEPETHGDIYETIKGLSAGAMDGLSLGGAPKIAGAVSNPTGALKALFSLIGKNTEDDKDVEEYEKTKADVKDWFDQTAADSPVAYHVGQFGSALPFAIPGGGALGVAKGAGALKELIAAAKLGAGYGAAQGLASSEADSLGGKLVDSAEGGLFGGAGGAAVGGLGKLASTAMPKTASAFKMGSDGEQLLTQAGGRKIRDTERQLAAEKLTDEFFGPDGLKARVGDKAGALRDKHAKVEINPRKVHANITDLISELEGRIPREANDKEELTNLLTNFTWKDKKINPFSGSLKKKMPVEDLYKLRRGLSTLSSYGDNNTLTNLGTSIADRSSGAIGKTLDKIHPDLAHADSVYNTLQEDILDRWKMKGLSLPRDRNVINDKFADNLFWSDAAGKIGSDKRRILDKVIENIRKLDDPMADRVDNLIKNTSNRIETTRLADNEHWGSITSLPKAIHGLELKGANTIGLGTHYLSKLPKAGFMAIGKELEQSQTPIYQKLGRVFTDGANRDDAGRNALIFTLMQNNAYREILGGLFNIDEPKK